MRRGLLSSCRFWREEGCIIVAYWWVISGCLKYGCLSGGWRQGVMVVIECRHGVSLGLVLTSRDEVGLAAARFICAGSRTGRHTAWTVELHRRWV